MIERLKRYGLANILMIVAICILTLWMLFITFGAISAIAQEVEPPPPGSQDEIFYTIDHDTDFQIIDRPSAVS